jgi:mannose-6-phosphate isomerase-like protein (cupin superfamily)
LESLFVTRRIPTPSIIKAAGNKTKVIEEFVGRVNSKTDAISIARMKSPGGWIEPGQTPEFDEYTVVIKGVLRVETKDATIDIHRDEAVIAYSGDWIRYSTPSADGAEYISICIPAFSPETVHRDEHL